MAKGAVFIALAAVFRLAANAAVEDFSWHDGILLRNAVMSGEWPVTNGVPNHTAMTRGDLLENY
jgi:hypothetical protein